MSDDGRHGLTIIALVGNVFSPWYAHARRTGGGVADPNEHVALNVCVYGTHNAWVYTERGGDAVRRDASGFTQSGSRVTWEDGALVVEFDERASPFGRPVRGRVRVTAPAMHDVAYVLDAQGRHRWWPVAPHARAEVELDEPASRWEGAAYHDANMGDEPLERGFAYWDWCRAKSADATTILYDRELVGGQRELLGLRFGDRHDVEVVAPPQRQELPRTWWGVRRGVRVDAGGGARVAQTLEDTPFYSRSVLELDLLGQHTTAVHESIELGRFDTRWVQHLLRYRMRREATPRR